MIRRTFLAITAGCVAGVPATAGADSGRATQDSPDCDETVEITVRDGPNGSETAERPVPWDEQMDRTSAVNRDINREYGDESWYAGSAVSLSADEELCGRPAPYVLVWATDVETASERIEDERDGVEIRVEYGEPAVLEDDDGRLSARAVAGGTLGLVGVGYLAARVRSD